MSESLANSSALSYNVRMIYLLPSLVSIIQGYFLLTVLLPKATRPAMPLFIFWGSLCGMATTALLTFSSLLFLNKLIPGFAIGMNIAATLGLYLLARQRDLTSPFGKGNWDKIDLIGLHLILLAHVPIIVHAIHHPDLSCNAWLCWNDMLEPALWQTNISHPMLLPLINVWAWCWSHTPDHVVILVTACRISLILSGILFFALKSFGGKPASRLVLLWILPIMLIIKLASRHYSDLLLSAWALSALLAFKLYGESRAMAYLALSIISLGMLNLIQPGGMLIAAVLCIIFGTAILLLKLLNRQPF